jgi:hypothetical protein
MKAWPILVLLCVLVFFGSVSRAVAPATETEAAASVAAATSTAGGQEPPALAAAKRDQTGYIKGFYVSYAALGNADFTAHMKQLLETTELNAVVLDFKSDRGLLTFPTQVPLAQEIGADQAPVIQDPAAFLQWFKDRNIYTIARIVTFKDNRLAHAHPEWAVTDANTGGLWRDPEQMAWIDPTQTAAWNYNIDLAKEAAALGFDEIQFDYVRFPTDGNVGHAVFQESNTYENRVEAIAGLLQRAKAALRPFGAKLGADVFGYTAWTDSDLGIGQDLAQIAPHLDVIQPMVYPSTFNAGLPGENAKYRNAIAYPYDIIYKSTKRALEMARATNPAVEIRPWLQDFQDYAFDYRTYTPTEIRLQMDAAREAGGRGWLLWDPAVKYTAGALVSAEPGFTPNPNGRLLVLKYRDFLLPGEPARAGAISADEFRSHLEKLLAAGFYPVNVNEIALGKLSAVPAGKRAVALTFDDSLPGQFRLASGGAVDPDSAVGVLLDFNSKHPADWPLRATFFVKQEDGQPGDGLFGTSDVAPAKLQLLKTWGMEIGAQPLGAQPLGDKPLTQMTGDELQQALGVPDAQIDEWAGGYQVSSLAVPDGELPSDRTLIGAGAYNGSPYAYAAAVLPDGGLAASPATPEFDPYRIPRVDTTKDRLDAWLKRADNLSTFYVSAGE